MRANPQGASVALAGASSLLGGEIKDQLAASGFPGQAVALLEAEELAGLLTEYGEEARAMTAAVREELLQHDLICLCGSAEFAAEQLQPLRDAGQLGIDCTGAWAHAPGTYLWLPGTNAEPELESNPAIALPSGPGQLVAVAMAALGELAEGAVATVLVPASERGHRGLKELSQQAIAVLNLEELEEAVFGRQLAFDIWPQPASGEHGSEQDLADELRRLDVHPPALSVLAAPVFHCIGAKVYLPAAAPDAVSTALGEAFSLGATDAGTIDSPVRVAGQPGIHVGGIRPEDSGGTWVWLITDNLKARAGAAVDAIHALLGSALAGSAGPV